MLGVHPRPGVHSSILKISASPVVSSKTALPCTRMKYVSFIMFLPGLRGGESVIVHVTQLLSFVVYAEDIWEDMLLFVLPSLSLCWAHALHPFSRETCCPF